MREFLDVELPGDGDTGVINVPALYGSVLDSRKRDCFSALGYELDCAADEGEIFFRRMHGQSDAKCAADIGYIFGRCVNIVA